MLAMHTVEPEEFKSRWREWYPDATPHGWAMREAYPHRWLRIRSLPGSKRLIAWSQLIADALARGSSNDRVRSYLKGFAKDTWQLTQWLTRANRHTRVG